MRSRDRSSNVHVHVQFHPRVCTCKAWTYGRGRMDEPARSVTHRNQGWDLLNVAAPQWGQR
jgi:hypothetical protein